MPSLSRLWSSPYTIPTRPFRVVTDDDVELAGDRLGAGGTALVFCHGFLGWRRKTRLVRFQERLARHFRVYAFDFRGHADSTGECAFGSVEHRDVEAVVRLARADGSDRVVTMGGSMGGIAVIRHGALVGGVEAVVAVSTPARWDGHDGRAIRRMVWLTRTRTGRSMLRAWGVRAASSLDRVESPSDVVGRIAPIPLLLVHGRDDHLFDEEQAWLLYRSAGQPKRLLLANPFGHAEDGYTSAFADRVAATVREALAG